MLLKIVAGIVHLGELDFETEGDGTAITNNASLLQ
jgi:myosin heavy subunit